MNLPLKILGKRPVGHRALFSSEFQAIKVGAGRRDWGTRLLHFNIIHAYHLLAG